ncbi:hypothetical protein MGYG_02707 [Nannizzia gypsea CBS 118893]|uniref:Uncharacterized protein n=1 Tax=Arthroderma gypseum (strain ATCC MYA-4604 / CBS 118893) TaxID=535722 RepID=E4UNU0_ARTGP|nr:hypothetical protein MGYG_02707 [Nannizzia gypsea CBS 118893]EFQ99693.1 hypothetical protein MGYG_02707 [Nannizzia gypsea CBS 118893]
MARALLSPRRNELTVSTGGSSDWRSLDDELTGTGPDADEGSASTGQKLADGFEKDYAIDISSLLTPKPLKPFRNLPNDFIPNKRTNNHTSNSRTEGYSITAQGTKSKITPKDSKDLKAARSQDSIPHDLKREGPYPLYPSQPTSEINITAELRKLWEGPNKRPRTFPEPLGEYIKPNIKGLHSPNDRPRFHDTTKTKTKRVIPESPAGRRGSSRFGTYPKHSGGVRDIPRTYGHFHPSPPLSPTSSDVLYGDRKSSVINTSTGNFPDWPCESKRASTSNPNLPLSPAASDGLESDRTSLLGSPTRSFGVPDMSRNSLQSWDLNYGSSRAAFKPPAKLLETDTTLLDFVGDKPTKQGSRFAPKERPPLRDLSSNGLKTRDALRKEAQIRCASIASSQKENFHPRKTPEYLYQNGRQGGRENFPRNAFNNFADFADALSESHKTTRSPTSGSDTGRLRKQTTRFYQKKSSGNEEFLPSADVTSNIDTDLHIDTSALLHGLETHFLPSRVSGTAAAVYRAGDKRRRSMPKAARFSRSRHSAASITDFRPGDADLTLTVSTGVSSVQLAQGATAGESHSIADNTAHRDSVNPLNLVFDLQSRLKCLEVERERLNRNMKRLNRENLALSDRVQVLEAANSTAGVRIGELSDENLSMNNFLRSLGKSTRAEDRQAQTSISNATDLRDREAMYEKTCLPEDDHKSIAGKYTFKQAEREVLGARDLFSNTPNTGEAGPPTSTLGEAHIDHTVLTLVDDHEVEDLRRNLEAARLDRAMGNTYRISTVNYDISMPPLSQVLASIGVGAEKDDPDPSTSEEEDMSTLPPIKNWVRRGL